MLIIAPARKVAESDYVVNLGLTVYAGEPKWTGEVFLFGNSIGWQSALRTNEIADVLLSAIIEDGYTKTDENGNEDDTWIPKCKKEIRDYFSLAVASFGQDIQKNRVWG